MTNLHQAHTDYLAKQAVVAEINADIDKIDAEISLLNGQISDAKKAIEAIEQRLKTSSEDIVNGNISSQDIVELKKSMNEQRLLIETIEGVIEVHIEAKKFPKIDSAKNQLITAKFKLNEVYLNHTLDKLTACQNEELKAFIVNFLGQDDFAHVYGKLDGDFLKFMALALCDAVFDKTPTFEQMREEREALIAAMD